MKLALRDVTKRFGTLVANDRISLTVESGEIHGLLGENGAGKSTLMNVLYGLYQADEGEILLDDKPVHFRDPGDAIAAGIGMVHQHFMLVPVFTVAENVMLGHEATGRFGILDIDAARKRVREISDRFGFHLDPDALVENLPVGIQQRVEIVKALSRDARVLVLDEPTAVLTPQETDDLMQIMRQLKESGTAIIFITHKLREIREAADRITVIRRGAVVGEPPPSASNAELAAMMVGRPVELTVHKDPAQPGPAALTVRDLRVTDDDGHVHVDGVSFEIRRGEVLGVAGVQGNGQTELTEALLGLQAHVEGSMVLDDVELRGRSVRRVLDAGVGFIPEDRQGEGLVGEFSIAENMMLNRSHGKPFVSLGTVQQRALNAFAQERLDQYDIRASGIDQHAAQLSGGNQQKVIVARELSRDLRLLVAAQPTRGVDVGSIEFIHKQIVATRDSGVPVLLVSTELDEIVALSDRIMVLYRGRVVGIVPAGTPRETLGLMMAGEQPEGSAA
ncbi:ABC transporter ATP-binding protein [Nocardioides panacisoli]|uniref:ABC transporter ATP-binding protein n=1 Tax=Nocardioides panacisoli TaxID=627624 RepID=A0ABP7HXX0_9ACTN